jgi:hypothetical protein
MAKMTGRTFRREFQALEMQGQLFGVVDGKKPSVLSVTCQTI